MRNLTIWLIILFFSSCSNKEVLHDASGNFESNEIIVSSEVAGKIISFPAEEGNIIPKDCVIVKIDAATYDLQQQQAEATITALNQKTVDVNPQIKLLNDQFEVQQSQLNNLLYEKTRTENLLKDQAVPQKQLDDINHQIDVLKSQMIVTRQQIAVQLSNVNTQNRSILSESGPLKKQALLLKEQLKKTNIINPITGTILTKYAEEGEITSPGKALYKIADLSWITLRAYITGEQLAQIKLNQQVKVYRDDGENKYAAYTGIITWISDKAEFTPKTIQTKDERANLVYAIKIKVQNDGHLKIGMYGEVDFK